MALEIEGSNPFAHPISPYIEEVKADRGLKVNCLSDLPANYVVVREGKPNGENWIFRIKTSVGREITAVAVSQPNISRTGPTWSYIFENVGINTIDVGSPGSFESLKDGYKAAGIDLPDIQNSIVSHGHSDHDGTIPDFIRESKADLCAHESYAFLKPYKSWDIQDFSKTTLQRELTAISKTRVDKNDLKNRVNRDEEYYSKRKNRSRNDSRCHTPNEDCTNFCDYCSVCCPPICPII